MRNKKKQLEKSSVWKSPIARNKFWLQCSEMFKKYKADSVISQFYQVINDKSIPSHKYCTPTPPLVVFQVLVARHLVIKFYPCLYFDLLSVCLSCFSFHSIAMT